MFSKAAYFTVATARITIKSKYGCEIIIPVKSSSIEEDLTIQRELQKELDDFEKD